MTLKILQLNMWAGKFLTAIIEYIKKNDFDIIQLQEVINGKWFMNGAFRDPKDNFQYLTQHLTDYHGELAVCMRLKNDKNSYFGNATFFKKDFVLLDKKIIWLRRHKEITESEKRSIQDDSRNALALKLDIKGKTVHFINTHFIWGPNPHDRKYKIRRAKPLYNYLKKMCQPFILSGDFNMLPNTKVIGMFDKLATNLTKKYKVTNTLNPDIHYSKELIPSGLAIDYIFISPDIKIHDFRIIDKPDLSDHYGLMAEVEI